MTEKIEIPLSKNKIFLVIVGSILLVAIGVWLFVSADSFGKSAVWLLRNPVIVKGIGVLGILFFGATAAAGIKKLFDKKIGLTIDSRESPITQTV